MAQQTVSKSIGGIEYKDGFIERVWPHHARAVGVNFTKPSMLSDTYPFIDPSTADFAGKSVFITGASKGLGRRLASLYAQCGASFIAVGSRTAPAELEDEIQQAAVKAGKPAPNVLNLKLDISDRGSVSAALEVFQKASPSPALDILINNAAYLNVYNRIGDVDLDDLWKAWEVNVKGTFLVTQAFLPAVLASSTKIIVNLTSGTFNAPAPGAMGYPFTKLIDLKMAEMLDYEYGREGYCDQDGLLAFSLSPGGFESDTSAKLPSVIKSFCHDKPELAPHTLIWLTRERREWLAGRYIDSTWSMEDLEKRKYEIVEKDLLKIRMDIKGI